MEKRSARSIIIDLPEQCFGIEPASKDIIRIKAGETGYHRCHQPTFTPREKYEEFVDKLNLEDGITKGVRAAMQYGSMFGWGCPAADPLNWNPDGTPVPDLERKEAA